MKTKGRVTLADQEIGLRLRLKRESMKITQQKLGEMIGVTFQQIQKYEKGANRISAATLNEISTSLDTPINYFFDNLNDNTPLPNSSPDSKNSEYNTKAREVLFYFNQIKDPSLEKEIINYIKLLKNLSDKK